MFSHIKTVALLIFIADVILLGVIVHYTSWLFMLAFVFISAAIGWWSLTSGINRSMRKIADSLLVNQTPTDLYLNAVATLMAGIFFIVPGILTDLLALLLLMPTGKRLTRLLIELQFTDLVRILAQRGPAGQNFDDQADGNAASKDEIIDVHVVNPKPDELKNER
jgi:UPF0716 family protein affecting phage T7 exclusion